MIRDGDGKDPEELASQLCRYYDERNLEDVDRLPKVTRKNVLILKYYSFENYFFNPAVMARLGIVESEDDFYRTLYGKMEGISVPDSQRAAADGSPGTGFLIPGRYEGAHGRGAHLSQRP